jgi:peptidoglycan/LPS O-acetylase OafA/YrhL
MHPGANRPILGRMPELDGVRAVAIILVITWHYFVGQVHTGNHSTLSYAFTPFRTMWSGVDLFFVLSGFLIGGIIIDNKDSPSFFKTFYIRRSCRIIPLYFLMIIVFVAVTNLDLLKDAWLFGPADQDKHYLLLSYLTFTQNFIMGYHDSFGPNWLAVTWSLAIEEQFYLLVPLIIVFFPRRWALAILCCLIAVSPLARWATGGLGAYVYPFCRADAILMGVLSAYAVRHPAWRAHPVARTRVLVGLMTAALIVVAYLTWRASGYGGIAVHFVFACLYSTFSLWVVASLGRPEVRLLRLRALGWIGERSYGAYLLHQGVNGLMHKYFIGHEVPRIEGLASFSVTIGSLVVTMLIADLSFRFLESIFIGFGHSFKYRASDVKISAGLAVT